MFTRRAEPVLSNDGRTFLSIPAGFGILTVPTFSSTARNFLLDEFYSLNDGLCSPHQISSALHNLDGRAIRNCAPVHFRVAAPSPQRLCLDLSTAGGDYVEISPAGFQLATGRQCRFENSPAFLPNCAPADPGPADPDPLETLRATLHIPDDENWLRLLAWLLTALHPEGPFPILLLRGPSASGKSVAARALRGLIDPVHDPLHEPTTAPRLLALARRHWIVALDRVRRLTPKLAEALCRLSSGVAVTVREPGDEPRALWTKRPIILTVNDDFEIPEEIADRVFCVTLPALARRRPEAALLEDLTPSLPQILGALCHAMSRILANPPDPRASYATRFPHTLALAQAAFPGRDFLSALNAPLPLPANLRPLQEFVRQNPSWSGTATDLLDALPALTFTPRALSAAIRRLKIPVTFHRTHGGTRILTFASPAGAVQ